LARATTPCHVFFPWYNTEHHHPGIDLLTPADVHHGVAEQRVPARATVLATAYAAHPERFADSPSSRRAHGRPDQSAQRPGVLEYPACRLAHEAPVA